MPLSHSLFWACPPSYHLDYLCYKILVFPIWVVKQQTTNTHTQQCIQCNGDGNQCVRVGSDGTGISNYDIVLYISADGTRCPSSETVAVATACQLEDSLDRPIAGNVNFCPSGVTNTVASSVLELAKHEATHALAFASTLFAYWRNADSTPRTPRNSQTGLPRNRNSEG